MNSGGAAGSSWDQLRERLRNTRGREYWRSLEELADSPEFRENLHREFPREAAVLEGPIRRREFVTLLGAMLAVSGFSGCGKPPSEKIVPYVRQPEAIVPGKPLFYATAMPFAGGALGLLVRNDMGRPTKIEGNPRHPASLGAAGPIAQAEIFTFWDPDRSQSITRAGDPGTWPSFLAALQTAISVPKRNFGRGIRILTESVLSPTLAGQLESLLYELPEARWHSFDPVSRDFQRAGSLLAFGTDVEPLYRLDKADVLFSLDSDFLSSRPGGERYAHDFAERRRRSPGKGEMNRLYAVETMPTVTGAMADHRWALRPTEIEDAARALAAALGVLPAERPRFDWIPAAARDLMRHAGRSLVIAGPEQPAAVHALAAAMNHALDNVGRTVIYIDPPAFRPADGRDSLASLSADMAEGKVEVLFILGGNPVYTAPADLDFERSLSRVAFRAHLSPYADETSWLCHWHLPEAHFLESWGDTLAFDGSASIIQPVIAPLYDGKTAPELVSALAGDPGRSTHDLVRDQWKRRRAEIGFEPFWQTALHEGVVAGTASTPRKVVPKVEAIRKALEPPRSSESVEVAFRPDPAVWDGRFANNPWLQELPKPLTKLTWDNAAMVAPAFAARAGLSNGDVVTLSREGRKVRAPVWVMPGHADRALTLHLGYGRSRVGRIGHDRGFNAYLLRTRDAFGSGSGLRLEKSGEKIRLASTQTHHSMEGREPVRVTTLDRLSREPLFVRSPEEGERAPSLYPEAHDHPYAWGMVIDLNTCSNCNACVVACQVENNVPVVGKDEVLRGREMHWIRVDTYHEGKPEHPEFLHQPVPCMHCEKAPCEVVCPTAATAHSSEGLNQMIYNRCVGTRYCQNNCPYKVRRFNFFRYADFETPQIQNLYNPDVTVRERGVMEKCSYCVQRITQARIAAEKEGRRIREGEVKTACQQACPNGSIVFGDLSRRRSELARLRSSPLHYELLGELNTRPRTTYLARVRNPNPELGGA
jgi:molybdopterin-containing oxidoreductase family iron-sulfur binding subunit